MKSLIGLFIAGFIFASSYSLQGQKVIKESIRSAEKDRTYYLFVPDKIDQSSPVPLVVLLHGSNRNGLSLVEKWKDLAKNEKFIIVGPDALRSNGWQIPDDGPGPIHELVTALRAKYAINPRRIYLFGHSAGAGQALYLSLLESEYFAATAVHAGALAKDDTSYIENSKRKIPIALFVGTKDQLFPLEVVRSTRDMLKAKGFEVELTEIKDHTHWYYDRAPEINQNAWKFLKSHELKGEPKYEQHRFIQ
jgi:poly(3-hydroxybutyrate) depolymerase